jgi:hypothetical protein
MKNGKATAQASIPQSSFLMLHSKMTQSGSFATATRRAKLPLQQE